MGAQILFIAPLAELADAAEKVIIEKFPNEKDLFKIVRADLCEAIDVAKNNANKGIEVIVSRGGTASLIEKEIDLPVVYIQVTIADILQSLLKIGNYPDYIAVSGFSNMIYGCEGLEKILNIKLTEILLSQAEDAGRKMKKAAADGVKLVVGDAISVKRQQNTVLKVLLFSQGRNQYIRLYRQQGWWLQYAGTNSAKRSSCALL